MAIESMAEEYRPLSPEEQKAYAEQCQGLVLMGQEHKKDISKPWP